MPTISVGTSGVTGVEGAVSRAAVRVSTGTEESGAGAASGTIAAVWVAGVTGLRLGTGGWSSVLAAGAAATCWGGVTVACGVVLQPSSPPTSMVSNKGRRSRPSGPPAGLSL